MKKLSLTKWRSVPPTIVFSGQEVPYLDITWPEGKGNEYIDPLTGALNRRAFDMAKIETVNTANKQGAGFGVIILDIDHFKHINDTYGHQAGDKVLQMFTAVVKSSLREKDFFARIGGEEFAIITPAFDMVFNIGERVRQAVEKHEIKIKDDTVINITCSFGCASYPDDAYEIDKLFELADQALYAAKNSGRNRGKKASTN